MPFHVLRRGANQNAKRGRGREGVARALTFSAGEDVETIERLRGVLSMIVRSRCGDKYRDLSVV
jgi:hypothetical protein